MIDLYDQVTSGAVSTRGTPGLNPMRRDTLWIEKGIVYVIAIKPDNPGVWAFHCHNDIHAKSGMFAQVIERPGRLQELLGTWTGTSGQGGSNWSFKFDDLTTETARTVKKALQDSVKGLMDQALVNYGWKPKPATQARSLTPKPFKA